jgi:hypothetical protein
VYLSGSKAKPIIGIRARLKMSTMSLEELVGRSAVVESRRSLMALSICCSRRSSGRHVGLINAAAWSARAKVVTSTVAVRKALTSMTSECSCRLVVRGVMD